MNKRFSRYCMGMLCVVMLGTGNFSPALSAAVTQPFAPAGTEESAKAQETQGGVAPAPKAAAVQAQPEASATKAPAPGGEMAALQEGAEPAAPAAPAPAEQAKTSATSTERRVPVKVKEGSILPLRVLTRPMAALYKKPDEKSEVVQSNLPVFMPFYVYTQPGGEDIAAETGWYEVGPDNRGTVTGWLKSADVFAWKQAMCLTYTHPEQRKPVLMFDGPQNLEALLGQSTEARAEAVKGLYATIDSGTIPQNFSIVSVEPKQAVDMVRQFYLLPILDHKVIQLDGREARLLELAAVSGGGEDAREKTDIRENVKFASAATKTSAEAAGQVAQSLKIDVVWVIDTTRSMGPYIDATKEVAGAVSAKLAENKALAENIRFGVWGYRDPVEAIPAIEYTTKNYTPQLQDIQSFLATMATVKETKTDSVDFPEDMFSGVSDAITQTQWTPGALRIVVLVGDAPGHELGHKWNLSGYGEETLRTLATEHNITLLGIQVRPKGAAKHQAKAEEQFKVLSLGKGSDIPAYYSIQGTDMGSFAKTTGTIVASLQGLLEKASSNTLSAALTKEGGLVEEATGEMAALKEGEAAPATAEASKAMNEGTAGLAQALKAAVVQWVGSKAEAKPPRDVVAWVVDKDLTDPARQSLEVRLLISKRQLDSLATLLNEVIAAGRTGQISGDDFFTSLQAASVVASRDPNLLKNAKTIGQSGLIPGFLEGLPYHSRLMDMSNELWNSWNVTEQDQFLSEMDARVRAYKSLHDTPEGWVTLNPGADADESVYPIPLELLP